MEIRWRTGLFFALALAVAGLLAALRFQQLRDEPRVSYLAAAAGADWIRANVEFTLYTYFQMDSESTFRHNFVTLKPLTDARLYVRALRRCRVELDSKTIYEDPADLVDWRQPREVKVPGELQPGVHRVRITVFHRGGHPCLWASSEALGLRTDETWLASVDRFDYSQAIRIDQREFPAAAQKFPPAVDAWKSTTPWLLCVFCLVFAWTLWAGPAVGPAANTRWWRLPPNRVRWLMVIAWLVLGANNCWRLLPIIGFDVREHLAYVNFIVNERSLPLATDGWQMFQSPLFYLLASPIYAAITPHFSPETTIKILRVLPLLCGLAQIEIVYRAARLVWPEKPDLQSIATVAGSLMPMNIYISQTIGNEPLAGCLSALVLLLCMRLLIPGQRQASNWYFALLGAIWGLALLSKVTAILLTPLVVVSIVIDTRARGRSWPRCLIGTATTAVTCLIVCGWYYLRNWTELGRPFYGGWDAATGKPWWQDPSFRDWGQLSSFGTALKQPVYSGVWSLWDSLYSSMWADGFVSGVAVSGPELFPWNIHWMGAAAWLGLVPLGLMFVGASTSWSKSDAGVRRVLLLAVGAIGIYLAAVMDLFMRLPIYSTAKATYTMGALPCYALLIAAGAAPWLRFRLTRAIILASMATWALAVFVTFFCVR